MVAVTYGVTGVTAPKNTGRARVSSPRKNVFTRLLTVLMEARLRQAHREITRHAHLLHRGHPLKTGSETGGW